jgi:hypothetical protein
VRVTEWRIAAALAILPAAGCAGRWLAVNDVNGQLRNPYPRDYRVALANDSVVIFHKARVRNDSLVEISSEQTQRDSSAPPRAVALYDIRQLELWQSRGERITGSVGLALVAGSFVLLWAISRALGGGGS